VANVRKGNRFRLTWSPNRVSLIKEGF